MFIAIYISFLIIQLHDLVFLEIDSNGGCGTLPNSLGHIRLISRPYQITKFIFTIKQIK